jgi:hypothetical protein
MLNFEQISDLNKFCILNKFEILDTNKFRIWPNLRFEQF